MLSWIIYIDNECEIHKAPKARNYKYLVRMYWISNELKYRNAEFMHRWYPTKEQQVRAVIIELGRFFTKEYLNK